MCERRVKGRGVKEEGGVRRDEGGEVRDEEGAGGD